MKDRELLLLPPDTGRLWLLGALLLVILPHLWRLPLWLSLPCTVIYGWRLAHEFRGWSLPGRLVKISFTLGGISAVVLLYRTVLGLEAGVALLTVMLTLKLLELRTLRDAMITLFLGYFMVASGFLFSQDIFTGLYLFLVVVTLTAALITLNHPAATRHETRYYLRLAGTLLLQSLPLMIALFLLFPRLNTPLWSMPQARNLGITGLSDRLEMGTITKLVESDEVAFRVDFDGEMPVADTLYWRGPVLWRNEGREWRPLRLRGETVVPPFEARGEEVSYTVTMEPSSMKWLFALDLPLTLPQGLEEKIQFLPDFQLISEKGSSGKRQYRLRSATDYRLPGLPDLARVNGLQLDAAQNPRTLSLAHAWKNEGLSDRQMVERALDFYQQGAFYYTRTPPALGDNPVDDFLFESRRGFCEHYAASFVTLMRAAGVPARVVTGYQGGERNPLGNYLIVRQRNAHAWAEVWLQEQGWRRVDPTSVVPPERVEEPIDMTRFRSTDPVLFTGREKQLIPELMQQLGFAWDAVNHGWNRWVLGFDRESQEELLKKLGLGKLGWRGMVAVLFGVLALLLGIITALMLLHRPRERDPVQRLYQRFCLRLATAGINCHPAEGPLDLAARAVKALPEQTVAINTITGLYATLRYSCNGGDGDIKRLRDAIDHFNP